MDEHFHYHLESNFGRNCRLQVRSLEKTARKLANFRNHLRFNLRCLHEGILPRSVRLTSTVTGHRANNILRNAERKLLNERIRQFNFTIDCLRQETTDRTRELLEKLPSDVFEMSRILWTLLNYTNTKWRRRDRRTNLWVWNKSQAVQLHSIGELRTLRL